MVFSKICVIGLGYIGLPTAAILASRKLQIIGVDVDPKVVSTINSGKIHIIEPDLDILVQSTVNQGFLRAYTTPKQADAYIIAVPTPFGENSSPNLSYIESASKSIAPFLEPGNLVILESTSPVGTSEKMADWLAGERPDLTFPQSHGNKAEIRIAHCPERVLPGYIIRELVENDRVIGGISEACAISAAELYKTFISGVCTLTDIRTAEMCKLVENAFRDINIAYANELSIICDDLGINVWELIELANRHPRVEILKPGPGVGGHCIAVDPWFIVSQSNGKAKLVEMARNVNDGKPSWVINKVDQAVQKLKSTDKHHTSFKLACYGISFKADIDDIRESPALRIALELSDKYPGNVYITDPCVSELDRVYRDRLQMVPIEQVSDADIHVLLVDHNSFRQGKPDTGIIVDTRGIWSQI